jgi:hypothetical protein
LTFDRAVDPAAAVRVQYIELYLGVLVIMMPQRRTMPQRPARPPALAVLVAVVLLGSVVQAQQHAAPSPACRDVLADTLTMNQMNLVCCGDAACASGLPKACSASCAALFQPMWDLCAPTFPEMSGFARACDSDVQHPPGPTPPPATAGGRRPRCAPPPPPAQSGHRRAQLLPASAGCIPEVEMLGSVLFPTNYQLVPTERGATTTLGGLSALSYDPSTQDWFSLSDRNALGGAFYRLRLPTISAGMLRTTDDIGFVETIDYGRGQIDAEGLAVCALGDRQPLYVSTEDPPMIASVARDAHARNAVTTNAVSLPVGLDVSNVRHNKQLESLTCDPDGQLIYTASEEPLLNDGPIPTVTSGGALRIEAISLADDAVRRTVRYDLEPGEGNGLADLEAVDRVGAPKQRLLTLERAWTRELGNTIRKYVVLCHVL